MSDEDVEDLKVKRICFSCIGDAFLKAEVKKSGETAQCSYCETSRKTISVEDLSDHVDRAFEEHFYVTPDQPSSYEYAAIKEGIFDWDRAGQPVVDAIEGAAGIPSSAAEDVQSILSDRHFDFEGAKAGEDSPFSSESYYEESGVRDNEMQADWFFFQKSLKTESRLFNRAAEAILHSIFDGLDKHVTKKGKKVLVKAGLGRRISSLYRARVFQSDIKLVEAMKRPDLELGPPPTLAASAGRMNARGISIFYGATHASVALSETRPPVGSQVLIGNFKIIKPLVLLDVEALRSIFVKGSVFDPSFGKQLEKAKFLASLSHRITMPVMPDDEVMEYLVTQAIADYLAGMTEPSIDGIIYSSVQSGKNKKNVALFHKSAMVERIDLPKGSDVTASTYQSTDDGPEPDYWVWEEVPPPEDKPKKKPAIPLTLNWDTPPWASEVPRQPTLRVDGSSLKVHHVEHVKFKSIEFPVKRHRSLKTEEKKHGIEEAESIF